MWKNLSENSSSCLHQQNENTQQTKRKMKKYFTIMCESENMVVNDHLHISKKQFCINENGEKNNEIRKPLKLKKIDKRYNFEQRKKKFDDLTKQKGREEIEKNQIRLQINQTSSTMRDVNNMNNQYADFRKTIFLKNRRKNPKYRNSVMGMKMFTKNDFQVIRKLGKGKYGKVYLVREKSTHFLLAMKIIEKNFLMKQNLIQQLIRQIKIQLYLDHPNIIKFYGFFDDQQHFYLLMQLGCDGQLYHYMENSQILSQQSTSFITKNLLDVVSYMHEHKILHRDIKPENIVLILGNMKLCDFGWAVYNITELRNTFCGTPLYFSPELLQGEKYNEKVDIWAIGILSYEMALGESPFNIKSAIDLPNIITKQIVFPSKAEISEEFKQFVKKILVKNPIERFQSKELLKLKFITDYNQIQTCQELCSRKFK